MGMQIVKQPNGLYAQWSSIVDDFTMIDATRSDIIADWLESETARIHAVISEVIKKLEAGQKPYHQFTMSFDECVARIRELHGENTGSLRLLRESEKKQPPPVTAGGEE